MAKRKHIDPNWTAEQPMPRPFMMRLVNTLAWVLPGSTPKCSPEWVMDRAKKQLGFMDHGDEAFLEAMGALIESYQREAGASFTFRHGFRSHIVRQMMVRLGVMEFLNRMPDIVETPVEQPLFIAGFPRTGTTLLHHLLAQDPVARPLRYWETRQPAPPPLPDNYETDTRIGPEEAGLQGLYAAFPQLAAIHYVEARGPEECNALFQNEFATNVYYYFMNIPSYVKWLLAEKDMRGPYDFYKKQLQMLACKFPPARWVLKAPMHLLFLDALLDVFPDACVVQTHRDPVEIVPSMCSLSLFLRRMSTGWNKPLALGGQIADHLAEVMERGVALRRKLDPARFCDVSYQRLVADPIAEVRRIYGHFGLDYTDAFEERMKTWMAENRQHKHGKHVYSMDQFGLKTEPLREMFADYSEAYREFL